uniref:Endoribonuclease YbeY n=1 Tax=candidate division WOR-3 bacterium TaxID=2052148 RepID=A0A7V3PUP3_UNCW3
MPMRTKKKANHQPRRDKLRVNIYGTADLKLKKAVYQQFNFLVPLLKERLPGGQINIVFTNNTHITELNRRYLRRNRPTDVLSFSIPTPFPVPEKKRLLGEIYISREQARRQAKNAGIRLKDELLQLVRHGLLHLAGFSHQEMNRLP